MATPEVIERHGYRDLYLSQKFDLWEQPDKRRLYVNVYVAPTAREMEAFAKEAFFQELKGRPYIDLITDHTYMTHAEPPEDLAACLDPFFSDLKIRHVVRVCQAETCQICLDMDADLPNRHSGRLLGRAPDFEAADGLLENQGE